MFFVYGLRSALPPALASKEIRVDSKPRASHRGRYRPPHLRNKAGRENDSLEGRSSDSEYSQYDLSSSDSDLSDSDGYAKNGDRFRSSKARLAAILCIQVCSYILSVNNMPPFSILIHPFLSLFPYASVKVR